MARLSRSTAKERDMDFRSQLIYSQGLSYLVDQMEKASKIPYLMELADPKTSMCLALYNPFVVTHWVKFMYHHDKNETVRPDFKESWQLIIYYVELTDYHTHRPRYHTSHPNLAARFLSIMNVWLTKHCKAGVPIAWKFLSFFNTILNRTQKVTVRIRRPSYALGIYRSDVDTHEYDWSDYQQWHTALEGAMRKTNDAQNNLLTLIDSILFDLLLTVFEFYRFHDDGMKLLTEIVRCPFSLEMLTPSFLNLSVPDYISKMGCFSDSSRDLLLQQSHNQELRNASDNRQYTTPLGVVLNIALMCSLDVQILYTTLHFELLKQLKLDKTDVRGVDNEQEMVFDGTFSQWNLFVSAEATRTSTSYTFGDYSAGAFNQIREMNQISISDYRESICNTNSSQFDGNSKSGSNFFVSDDGQYVIKSIKKSEVMDLLSLLPNLLAYLQTRGDTLLCKVFGLHRVASTTSPDNVVVEKVQRKMNKTRTTKTAGAPTMISSLTIAHNLQNADQSTLGNPTENYVDNDTQEDFYMVLGSIFDPKCVELEIYDIKGSEVSRDAGPEALVKKDINWLREGRKLNLNSKDRKRLLRAHASDCRFLREMGIFDYSLLIGIVEAHQVASSMQSVGGQTFISADGKEIYFVGIVDYITTYKTWRYLHTTWKFIKSGGPFAGEISPVPPNYYCERQIDFVANSVVG